MAESTSAAPPGCSASPAFPAGRGRSSAAVMSPVSRGRGEHPSQRLRVEAPESESQRNRHAGSVHERHPLASFSESHPSPSRPGGTRSLPPSAAVTRRRPRATAAAPRPARASLAAPSPRRCRAYGRSSTSTWPQRSTATSRCHPPHHHHPPPRLSFPSSGGGERRRRRRRRAPPA